MQRYRIWKTIDFFNNSFKQLQFYNGFKQNPNQN